MCGRRGARSAAQQPHARTRATATQGACFPFRVPSGIGNVVWRQRVRSGAPRGGDASTIPPHRRLSAARLSMRALPAPPVVLNPLQFWILPDRDDPIDDDIVGWGSGDHGHDELPPSQQSRPPQTAPPRPRPRPRPPQELELAVNRTVVWKEQRERAHRPRPRSSTTPVARRVVPCDEWGVPTQHYVVLSPRPPPTTTTSHFQLWAAESSDRAQTAAVRPRLCTRGGGGTGGGGAGPLARPPMRMHRLRWPLLPPRWSGQAFALASSAADLSHRQRILTIQRGAPPADEAQRLRGVSAAPAHRPTITNLRSGLRRTKHKKLSRLL
jgi:hypothetical protein